MIAEYVGGRYESDKVALHTFGRRGPTYTEVGYPHFAPYPPDEAPPPAIEVPDERSAERSEEDDAADSVMVPREPTLPAPRLP